MGTCVLFYTKPERRASETNQSGKYHARKQEKAQCIITSMNTVQLYIQKIKFDEKYTPLAFFIITLLGFGLLANKLGFYQDDWPYVFFAFNKGIPSLKEELFYDSRPNAAWLYIGLFNLLRFNPMAWHYAAAILRWITATILWYFLKRVWPENKREVTFAILIFIVHPFFLIQPYAVNSMLYWSGYFFFAASLLIMARNVTEKNHWILFTVIGVFFEGLHLFTTEYFVAMVLIRPFVLYWMISRQESNVLTRLKKSLGHWVPYLTSLAAYLGWRLFLFNPPPGGDRNTPRILYALFESPATTIPYLIRTALQDSVIITFASWYRTLVPELFAFGSRFNWFMITVSVLVFLVTYLFLMKTNVDEPESKSRWFTSPISLGLLIIFLGMTPLWLIGQDIVTHKNQFAASRFGFGSTLGAAMIIAVICVNFIDMPRKKIAAISVLVALAVSMHLRNAKSFADAWEKQERFSRELVWRAPEIEPGAAILTDEEILGYMGSYSVSFAIITSYQPGDIQTAPYWYFPFYYTNPNIGDILEGIPLQDGRVNINFSGTSKKMILFSFNPEMNRCLWVLSPEDTNLHLVSEDMRQLSAGSDIDLIKQNSVAETGLPEGIYGKQNNDTWCYYFEKADLARQDGEWDRVVHLLEEAQSNGERAANGFEYIPFIEGYGHQENWEQVKFLTKAANRITSGLEPSLCSAMDRLSLTAPKTQLRDDTIKKLKEDLKCRNYQ